MSSVYNAPTPTHHLKSLRDYISALQALDELQIVEREVDLDLEIGAICRRCYETGAPSPLFENIRGVAKGWRVLGAPAGLSSQREQWLARLALSLGLPATSTGRDLIEAMVAARLRTPLPPRVVDGGPCKENILLGEQVDLTRLPAPLLHDGDGGRYINTYGVFVARTLDKTWTNWSVARAMLSDKTHMTGIVAPNQHLGMVFQTWKDAGQDMPFALALGAEPSIPFVGGMPLPAQMNEADYLGAYFDEPIDVVRCETVALDVPASAEIVLEGTLSITDTAPEGPMGEYAGYLWAGETTPRPRYHVTAMTYRSDPILPISVAGEPTEENHTAWGVPNAAEIVYQLRQAGFPVTMAWSPFESAIHWVVITVARDWRDKMNLSASAFCRAIGDHLLQSKAGGSAPKYLIMNDDIDATNTAEVVWAFATRNHPGSQGEEIFDNENITPLVAFLKKNEKSSAHTAKVIYNCLPPDDWGDKLPKRASFAHDYTPELQRRVLANWTDYGFTR